MKNATLKNSTTTFLVLLLITACSSNKRPQPLDGMQEAFSVNHSNGLTTFELTAKRIYAEEAFTLNKREINSVRKQAIHILDWHLGQAPLCEQGYLLTQQTISAALVKLRGECR